MALSRTQIVDEALRLVDEKGLDGLSLRTLATRLHVQAPTLYWHLPNKSALLDAVSDAIMGEALDGLSRLDDAQPTDEWMLAALVTLRDAMLAHRDGARIVSGAHDSLRRAEFVELGMRRLLADGVDERRAWLLMLAATRYALGHVLAEQGPDAPPSAELEPEFRRRFPHVARSVSDYFATHTADDLYHDAVQLLLARLSTPDEW
jgi:TetR/AcrR family tetracycline transcriptional repressor